MSLVQNYSITYDENQNYTLQFNTSELASVTYSIEKDGTNVITVNNADKGEQKFTHKYTSKNGVFKYVFDQPDDAARGRRRIPGGSMIP